MELIYVYIDSFRNYKKVGISLSDKFKVSYDSENNSICIEKNSGYINIYPSNIQNVSAIVGKNSVGKTNFLDLLGMKIDDRNNNHAEYKAIYEKNSATRLGKKIVGEEKYAKYFMVYYLGIFDNEDLYCFEGNFIEDFHNIVANDIPKERYFESKLWFSLVCRYSEDKFIFYKDTQDWSMDFSNHNFPNSNALPCLVSFRTNYNSDIYDYLSYKPNDDLKISIPRRIAKNVPHFKKSILNLLVKMMNVTKSNSSMFKNEKYIFSIEYNENYYTENKPFFEVYKTFSDTEYNKSKLIESFLSHTFYKINDTESSQEKARKIVSAITINGTSYSDAVNYYKKLYLSIIGTLEYKLDTEETKYAVSRFEQLINALENSDININRNGISITVTFDSDISKYENVIALLDDDYRFATAGELFAIYSSFIESKVNFLSDGESYYLGLFASIDEQLNDPTFCKDKTHFILLFDEPEANMHPDLARSFINDLITFLENYPNKYFQIIISTHSPFILSDLLPGNVTLLNKGSDGCCKIEPCNISTFSANIHDILSNSFFMSSTIGAYSKNILDNIIKALKDDDDPEKYGLDKIPQLFKKVYGKFSKNNINNLIIEKSHILVCPYCNENFITNRGNAHTSAQLDHFFDQSSNPLFSICLYNLIPCCPTCNHIKTNAPLLVSPFNSSINRNQFKITYSPTTAEFITANNAVSIDFLAEGDDGEKILKDIKQLDIDQSYKYHNEYLTELLKKAHFYNHSQIKELKELFGNEISSEEELNRLIFGNYTDSENINSRPLSKLTRDILKELKIIE